MKNTIHILYGTTTGNSEILAGETAEILSRKNVPAHVCSMEDFCLQNLHQLQTLLVIVSTDSGGNPPIMAEDFYEFLNETDTDLRQLFYSVLALGDSYYTDFCQTGKDVDEMLEKLGAHRMLERIDCDFIFWENYDVWIDKIIPIVMKKEPIIH